MLLGLAELSDGVTGLPVVAASLSLVGLVLIISWRLQLGISREIVVAVARAAVQLLTVGALFTAIFRSSSAIWFAAGWVVFMVTVATTVITRRAEHPIRGLTLIAGIAVLGSALISITVIFGFGVFDFDAVTLVVVGGITIGNAVPAVVLGVNLSVTTTRDGIGTLEGLLALGFDRRAVVRFMTPRIAKTALIPQIERTKVVGLIALPGALVGLLLAGVDPVDAVAVQLLVMYLVLGTAAVSLISTVVVVMRSSVTDQLVPTEWTKGRIRRSAVRYRDLDGCPTPSIQLITTFDDHHRHVVRNLDSGEGASERLLAGMAVQQLPHSENRAVWSDDPPRVGIPVGRVVRGADRHVEVERPYVRLRYLDFDHVGKELVRRHDVGLR